MVVITATTTMMISVILGLFHSYTLYAEEQQQHQQGAEEEKRGKQQNTYYEQKKWNFCVHERRWSNLGDLASGCSCI